MTKKKISQTTKEALLALSLTCFYLVMWFISGYCLSNKPGLMGFPIWFEFSCIFLPIIFIILTFFIIRYFYKDISLDANHEK